MRLTKFEHAEMVLEQDGAKLVIDPGGFSAPLPDASGVVAIVITHEHVDHWTPDQLTHILETSPGIPIYAPQGVANAATAFDVTVVTGGDTAEVGPFSLAFFGQKHAVIHRSIPVVDNVGVLVNGAFYYPGDSFTVPDDIDVDTLAVPASAPWLKISEVMDFLADLTPRRAFPAHEALLSQLGMNLTVARITDATTASGGEFVLLEPGDSLDF